MTRPYLGSYHVVWNLLVQMLGEVREEPSQAQAVLRKAAAIFSGNDPAYASINPWHPAGLAGWIRVHIKGIKDGDAEETVAQALAVLVLQLFHVMKEVGEGRMEEGDGEKGLRAFLEDWTRLMLGIPFGTPIKRAMTRPERWGSTKATAEQPATASEELDEEGADEPGQFENAKSREQSRSRSAVSDATHRSHAAPQAQATST